MVVQTVLVQAAFPHHTHALLVVESATEKTPAIPVVSLVPLSVTGPVNLVTALLIRLVQDATDVTHVTEVVTALVMDAILHATELVMVAVTQDALLQTGLVPEHAISVTDVRRVILVVTLYVTLNVKVMITTVNNALHVNHATLVVMLNVILDAMIVRLVILCVMADRVALNVIQTATLITHHYLKESAATQLPSAFRE